MDHNDAAGWPRIPQGDDWPSRERERDHTLIGIFFHFSPLIFRNLHFSQYCSFETAFQRLTNIGQWPSRGYTLGLIWLQSCVFFSKYYYNCSNFVTKYLNLHGDHMQSSLLTIEFPWYCILILNIGHLAVMLYCCIPTGAQVLGVGASCWCLISPIKQQLESSVMCAVNAECAIIIFSNK